MSCCFKMDHCKFWVRDRWRVLHLKVGAGPCRWDSGLQIWDEVGHTEMAGSLKLSPCQWRTSSRRDTVCIPQDSTSLRLYLLKTLTHQGSTSSMLYLLKTLPLQCSTSSMLYLLNALPPPPSSMFRYQRTGRGQTLALGHPVSSTRQLTLTPKRVVRFGPPIS